MGSVRGTDDLAVTRMTIIHGWKEKEATLNVRLPVLAFATPSFEYSPRLTLPIPAFLAAVSSPFNFLSPVNQLAFLPFCLKGTQSIPDGLHFLSPDPLNSLQLVVVGCDPPPILCGSLRSALSSAIHSFTMAAAAHEPIATTSIGDRAAFQRIVDMVATNGHPVLVTAQATAMSAVPSPSG